MARSLFSHVVLRFVVLAVSALAPSNGESDFRGQLYSRGAALVCAGDGIVNVRPFVSGPVSIRVWSLQATIADGGSDQSGVQGAELSDRWKVRRVGQSIFFVLRDQRLGSVTVLSDDGRVLSQHNPSYLTYPVGLIGNGLTLVGARIHSQTSHPQTDVVSISSGRETVLFSMPGVASQGRGALAVLPDGSEIVLDLGGRLEKCTIATGQCDLLGEGQIPSVSPDGRLIAFRGTDSRAVVASLEDPSRIVFRSKAKMGYDSILWSPASDAILIHEASWLKAQLVAYRLSDRDRAVLWDSRDRTVDGCVWINDFESWIRPRSSGR